VTHGSYFWYAHKEGLLAANQSNIVRALSGDRIYFLTHATLQHVGIRNALSSWEDLDNDAEVGFVISYAEDVEEVGWKGIVKRIREIVGDNSVYISLDIDVIDPGMAPA
jgi:agmatinase